MAALLELLLLIGAVITIVVGLFQLWDRLTRGGSGDR